MSELKKIIAMYIEGVLDDEIASSPFQSNEHQLAKEDRRKWLEDLSSWIPHSPLFKWDYIQARFATSVWKTAHTRYKQWHSGLPKRSRSESDDDGVGRRQRPANGNRVNGR